MGTPPGTALYTGEITHVAPQVDVMIYTATDCYEKSGADLDACLPAEPVNGVTWINVTGLENTQLITNIGQRYHLHPLTVEDILNVQQRPKVDEFDNYYFITLKVLDWNSEQHTFSANQFSLILGKDYVLSFNVDKFPFFEDLRKRIAMTTSQRLREHGSDYLAYRLLDAVIDNYFIVLEKLGDEIEDVQEQLINNPSTKNSRALYHLQHQILLLRKFMWPTREVINHLSRDDAGFITSFTRVYLRDVYDHAVQAIDILETFRDMLSGMLDVYLTSLTNRMNEIMKFLTIIATIFIPITFIASIYGMNFTNMPELHWRYGYPTVLFVMLLVSLAMLYFFWRKKWF